MNKKALLIGLGVISVGTIGYYFWMNRKKTTVLNQNNDSSVGLGGALSLEYSNGLNAPKPLINGYKVEDFNKRNNIPTNIVEQDYNKSIGLNNNIVKQFDDIAVSGIKKTY